MKKIFTAFVSSFSLLNIAFSQSVAVNNDGTDAHPSAMFEIKSNNKGLLIPRMSTAERTAIDNPATGLIVYDTDLDRFYFHGSSGWIEVTAGGTSNYWSLNGTHIFKNNGGNVGIGISIPGAALHIKRDLEALRLEGSFSYLSLYNNTNAYTGFFGLGSNQNNVALGTGGSNSAGSVQIWNNGHVNMDVLNTGLINVLGSNPQFSFYRNGNLTGEIAGYDPNLEISAFRPTSAVTTPGNLLLQVPVNTQFATYYAGNVGIGVTNAAFKLDVGGRIRLRSEASGGLTAGMWFNNYDNTQYTGFIGEVGTGAPNHLGIFGSSSGWSFVMNTVTGNVGIGKFNPGNKLEVNGTVRSKEVVVDNIAWPDYVFGENYKLASLDDIARFVRENKHLPDIPSAKEVEEKGLHLGDMQKKMMEKIEELTLYVIELKKEIDKLKHVSK